MTEKTTLDLEAAERLANAATPGPWGTEDDVNPHLITCGCDNEGAFLYIAGVDFGTDADAAFIAASRELVPALIAEVSALRASQSESVRAADEDAAKIAEGFVIDETQAPSIRASRIASAIRARANGGKSP